MVRRLAETPGDVAGSLGITARSPRGERRREKWPEGAREKNERERLGTKWGRSGELVRPLQNHL